ncbi:MAG: MMPL family transporter [Opitutales bacterium]|nr:MMPL family transporter [Opitutales bacterium]
MRIKNLVIFLIAAVALCVFAALRLTNAAFDENPFDILAVVNDSILSQKKAAENLDFSRKVYFNISGKNALIAAENLAKELEKSGAKVNRPKISPENFENAIDNITNSFAYIFNANRESFLNGLKKDETKKRLAEYKKKMLSHEGAVAKKFLAKDPFGMCNVVLGYLAEFKDQNSDIKNGFLCKNGNVLIVATADFAPSNAQKSADFYEFTNTTTATIDKKWGTQTAFSGGCITSAENAKISKSESSKSLYITAVLLACICAVAFKRKVNLIFAIAPALAGMGAAFCILTFVYAKVSVIALAFAAIAVGVGIDYAIHIIYALESGSDPNKIFAAYAKPVCIAAGTSIAAFAIIFLFSNTGFAQLGFFGSFGILLTAIFTLCLPFLYKKSNLQKISVFEKLGQKIYNIQNRFGKALFFAAVLSVLPAAFFAFKINFENDINSLNGISGKRKSDSQLITQLWANALYNDTYAVVYADTPEALRQNNELLAEFLKAQNLEFKSAGVLCPSNKSAQDSLENWQKFWASPKGKEAVANFYESARELGFKPEFFKDAIYNAQNKHDIKSLQKTPFRDFAENFISQKAALTIIKNVDGEKFEKLERQIREFMPSACLYNAKEFGKNMATLSKIWTAKFACFAVLFAAVYLLVMFKSIKKPFVVMLSVFLGILWAASLMGIFKISINPINAIFVIFAICLAQDYAVFTICAKDSNPAKTQACVALSATTTIIAFGSLALTQSPVLKSLGLAAALSILCVWLASTCITYPLCKIFIKDDAKR